MHIILFFILSFNSIALYSGPIYQCKAKDGSIMLSDLGCELEQRQLKRIQRQETRPNTAVPKQKASKQKAKSKTRYRTPNRRRGGSFFIPSDTSESRECRRYRQALQATINELASGYKIQRGEWLKAERERLRRKMKTDC